MRRSPRTSRGGPGERRQRTGGRGAVAPPSAAGSDGVPDGVPGAAGDVASGRRVGSGSGVGEAAGCRPVSTENCQRYPPSCPCWSRTWIRTSCRPAPSVRTMLMDLTRTGEPPRSIGTASPSTNAVTSTRSLEPVMRAPMTTSPAGSAAPGAGCRLLTIGYGPGEPAGLAARTGTGEAAGPRMTVGVAVRARLAAAAVPVLAASPARPRGPAFRRRSAARPRAVAGPEAARRPRATRWRGSRRSAATGATAVVDRYGSRTLSESRGPDVVTPTSDQRGRRDDTGRRRAAVKP
jgi:hypothetical protein